MPQSKRNITTRTITTTIRFQLHLPQTSVAQDHAPLRPLPLSRDLAELACRHEHPRRAWRCDVASAHFVRLRACDSIREC
eukprot:2604633-Prymnesium_polylepis.1